MKKIIITLTIMGSLVNSTNSRACISTEMVNFKEEMIECLLVSNWQAIEDEQEEINNPQQQEKCHTWRDEIALDEKYLKPKAKKPHYGFIRTK